MFTLNHRFLLAGLLLSIAAAPAARSVGGRIS